jgi:peptidoglycan/LPS O-acetylase OafA/YrhL
LAVVNPYPPQWPPAGPPPGRPPTVLPQPPAPKRPDRPDDVVTGFWLWLLAVPLMVAGQFADGYVVARSTNTPAVLLTTGVLAVVIGVVVMTLVVLMRSGYRWTRTVLTAGGVATILYTAASLFGTPRPTVPAIAFAFTGIVGAVLIAGGIFLLHRPDSSKFFDR